MTTTPIRLLLELVDQYDEAGTPITPESVAAAVETDPETVRASFEDFESKHLLKPVDGGYRPTITARELLALDIDDDALVILDAQPES